ncbi:IPT/TIG domain-containing protein [Deinococcus peraridilitoris]|uniref:IPT/TIG domain-containing protein n=1 Tax=Deinococcus peraridilitoris (strain DSM 19664 / LMG 22246 / CIP 109416 / KR-200) TaxID=937777 RepID=L0A7I9_DEIPD|nr:IPT/TIG domain-containing protein [Deinococcus peraridilitoris]AFZ69127.1 IPT/TIG domain-containing protein [Deinococcus peraridilitoris DSM 19664]
MLRVLLCSVLLLPALAGCAPRSQAVAGVTVTPVLIKVSESARVGEPVTVQGRYLGGPKTGRIRLGATENGNGGYLVPADAIVSWTDSQIVFRVPPGAPAGAFWLFIEVGDMRSTGLPYSIKE